MTGTVPVNKKLLTGTVPVNKELLTGTVPVNNLFLNFISLNLNWMAKINDYSFHTFLKLSLLIPVSQTSTLFQLDRVHKTCPNLTNPDLRVIQTTKYFKWIRDISLKMLRFGSKKQIKIPVSIIHDGLEIRIDRKFL